MKEKLAKLINVKSIVTLVLIIVFAYLSVAGKEVSDQFSQVLMMVLSFFFGTQATKTKGGE